MSDYQLEQLQHDGRPGTPPMPAAAADQNQSVQGLGYLEYYTKVVPEAQRVHCSKWFVTGHCKNGHTVARELLCGKEWCPICGAKGSKFHNRRIARWLPKAQQMRNMAYLVLTIPEEIRYRYRTKESLNELMAQINGDKSRHIKGLIKECGLQNSLQRWHFFGDESNKYNPHLNVLADSGWIPPETIEWIKKRWAEILNYDGEVSVNYQYTREPKKMMHWIRYVTRATFLDLKWDEELAHNLWNFRNTRSFGNWERPHVWKLPRQAEYEAIRELENCRCPVCHEHLTWTKPLGIAWLQMENKTELRAGYYMLRGWEIDIPRDKGSPGEFPVDQPWEWEEEDETPMLDGFEPNF